MGSRRRLFLAGLFGLLFLLPSLWLGFVLNDLVFVALLEGWYPEMGQPLNLYASFFDMPHMPWWLSPETRIAFWRPLSSALLWLDHALFGLHPLPYHLHSLLWFVALLVLVERLYRRMDRGSDPISGSGVAALALCLFAIDESHILTFGWICGRHAAVAVVLALCGLLAHLRFREEGWRWGLPLSLLGFGAGLAAGETALGILAYALAWELFGPPSRGAVVAGPSGTFQGGLRGRLVGILPMTVLTVAYLLLYHALGQGVSGTTVYLDPGGDPLTLLSGLGRNLPALLASIFWGLPAGFVWVEVMRWPQLGLAVAALVGVVIFWWWNRRPGASSGPGEDSGVREELRWLLPGAFGALLPTSLAPPDERLLLAPMIGLAPLLALCLIVLWRRCRRGGSEVSGRKGAWRRRAARTAAGVGVFLVAAIHLLGPAGARYLKHVEDRWLGSFHDQLKERLPVEGPDAGAAPELVLINSPGNWTLGYYPLRLDLESVEKGQGVLGIAGRWHVLSEAPHGFRLRRTGPRVLEMEILDGVMLASPGEQMFRPEDRALEEGDRIDTRLFRAEILTVGEVEEEGTRLRGPTRVAFHFHRDLDDPGLIWRIWSEEGIQIVTPPVEGKSLEVKEPPDLLDLWLEGDEE